MERMEADIRFIRKAIDGNGTPERGFIVRLDRIEQRAKLLMIFVGALIAAAAAQTWAAITGKGGG
jgi:hypothetical protein